MIAETAWPLTSAPVAPATLVREEATTEEHFVWMTTAGSSRAR